MKIEFVKYSATGNDFIVIDNRNNVFDDISVEKVQKICTRRSGVGADGILLLEDSLKADFLMRIINADGSEVSMCGNGGRAIIHYAHNKLHLKAGKDYLFETSNGLYAGSLDCDGVRLRMDELYDVGKISLVPEFKCLHSLYLNTGVPHAVFEIDDDLDGFDLIRWGKKIGHEIMFANGANVNLCKIIAEKKIALRTYERGVEDETFSCGTGAMAAAVMLNKFYGIYGEIEILVKGGTLKVILSKDLSERFLCGKVEKIFEGLILICEEN